MKYMEKIRAWIKRKWEELDETPEWLILKEGWGGRPHNPDEEPIDFITVNKPECLPWPLPYMIIHSTLRYADPGDDPEKIKETIREIQDDDMDEYEFDDIGYNFLVGGNGYVYEGRGWRRAGNHTFSHNEKSIGVALLGDFSDKPPRKEMIAGTRKLIEEGLKKGYLKKNVQVVSHGAVVEGAACPSKCLREEIDVRKSFQPDQNWAEWAWLYFIKRLIDESPVIVGEYVSETWKDWRSRWRESFIRTCIMYIWYN